MNSILVAGLLSFAGAMLLTISLCGFVHSLKDAQSNSVTAFQKRLVELQEKVNQQRDAQLEILKEIRDALRGGAK